MDKRAEKIITKGIYSHKIWMKFLIANPDYPTNDVGSVERHKQWIEDYNYLKELLKNG